MTTERVERRLAAILSADVVGYSRMMAVDEKGTLARLQALRRDFIDPEIARHKGRIVKLMGDGALVEFASVVDAVECAVEVQRGMAERNAESSEDERIDFRIGINLGDIIIDGDDIQGDGVNIAARLEQTADPGGIVLSGAGFDQARNKVGVAFEDIGPQSLKNIPEPVRTYRVLLDPVASGAVSAPVNIKARQPRRTRWVIAGAALAVVVIGAVVGVLSSLEPWVRRVEPADPTKMAFALPERPSIVVLPFDNLTGDETQDFIGDGLTENIIAVLSSSPDLLVIARNSSFTYKGQAVRVQEVAEQLGVRYVLEGSVKRDGNRLRITAQLIDTIDGLHLWAETYDRELGNLFELEDDITQKILEAMHVELTLGQQAKITRELAPGSEAYRLSILWRAEFQKWSPEGHKEAERLATELLERHPDSTLATTSMGWVLWQKTLLMFSEDPQRDLAEARLFAEKSITIDEAYYQPYLILATVDLLELNHASAIAHADRAIELEPGAADANLVGGATKVLSGQPAEGVELLKKGMRQEPLMSMWAAGDLTIGLMMLGRYDEAKEVAERILNSSTRGDIWAHSWALSNLAVIAIVEGDQPSARRYAERLLEDDPTWNTTAIRQYNYRWKDQDYLKRHLGALHKAGVPEHPPLPLPDKPSIVVLPFDNLAADDSEDWVADGMTDDLIIDLSKISGLFVIARNTAFTYKDQAVDVKTVGRDLGVRHVLEGSIRRIGGQVRINVQLIDAVTGGHLWAEKYDGPEADFFALQDQVIDKIVTALAVALTPGEQSTLVRAPTENFEAYEHYRRGVHALANAVYTPGGMKEAFAEFEKAIARDPNFAEAHAGLARTAVTVLGTWKFWIMPAREAWEFAEVSAGKALALDPNNVVANSALAELERYDGEHAASVDRMRAAASSNPSSAEAYRQLAYRHRDAGEHAEAVEALKVGYRLDPTPPLIDYAESGLLYFYAGDYQRAADLFEWVVNVQPEDAAAWLQLAATYMRLDREDEAHEVVERLKKLWPTANVQLWKQTYARNTLKRVEDQENFTNALRQAGFNEWVLGAEEDPANRLSEEELSALTPPGSTVIGTVDFGQGPIRYVRLLQPDLRYQLRSKLWADVGTYGGIEDGMRCIQSDVFYLTKPYCGYAYRNPAGTSEGMDEYIWIAGEGINRFSVWHGQQLTSDEIDQLLDDHPIPTLQTTGGWDPNTEVPQ